MPRANVRRSAGLIAAVVFLITGAIWVSLRNGGPSENRETGAIETIVKSGNLSVDYTISQALADVDRLGLNMVNVPIMVTVEHLSSSSMALDPESVSKAIAMIRELRGQKVKVLLEPYPWIGGGEYYETEWKPDDADAFFREWGRIVEEVVDKVAIPESADAVCVASNLVYLEQYEDRWVDLIDRVKARYDGSVTYRTNWWYTAEWDEQSRDAYERKLNNGIFGKVDFISIAAYFELTDRPRNTVKQLREALRASTIYGRNQNIVGEIERLHEKWNKPIFFGELGFPKREYAAMQPWNPAPSDRYSAEEQARAFEAYRLTFDQAWFMGFSVFAIGLDAEDKSYYPSEESAAVIRDW
ncbi:glycoside hydrolase family 113 [Paenibacillaceae bacterium WGS1546]|uniref:glycoside hydrolase family 113 n=1 Tax=Cohnella sp. WGS1546 TaxID=3366810 RepID=UPI00372D758F